MQFNIYEFKNVYKPTDRIGVETIFIKAMWCYDQKTKIRSVVFIARSKIEEYTRSERREQNVHQPRTVKLE
jgi:hypothetical protein